MLRIEPEEYRWNLARLSFVTGSHWLGVKAGWCVEHWGSPPKCV